MNENTEVWNNPVPVEAPKRRGNPNWGKKKDAALPVIRVSVTSEGAPQDIWTVGNRDPAKVYKWGRKSSMEEMTDFAHKGYEPARGNEKILGNPFEATEDTTGQTKERGDRILMCCPKELVDARERTRLNQQVSAKDAARNDARKMSGKGVLVKPIAEETTRRESLQE